MQLNSNQISYLRGLAHSLNPVVMLGNNGLTERVLKEIELNLNAHELIKIQVANDDRAARKSIYTDICEQLHAVPVHQIGKQLVIYRASSSIKEGAKAKILIPKS